MTTYGGGSQIPESNATSRSFEGGLSDTIALHGQNQVIFSLGREYQKWTANYYRPELRQRLSGLEMRSKFKLRRATAMALCAALLVGGVRTTYSMSLNTPPVAAQELFSEPQVAELAEAAAAGRLAEIQRLIKQGVDVNSRGLRGLTPLGFALGRHNLVGAEALLQLGADPNFMIDDPASKRPFAFILIVGAKGTAEELALMLRYGGDANAKEPPTTRVQAGNHLHEADSLLILSVLNLAKVKALVQHGADINYVPHPESASTGGTSAIVRAARQAQLPTVNYLLEHGAVDLDETADAILGRPWANSQKAEQLDVLRKIRDKGGRIYAAYRPALSDKIQIHQNKDIPADWITPGFLDFREVRKAQLLRWEQQQKTATLQSSK